MRDDFPEPVKRTAAARTGHRCSNPDCGAATSGPQVDADKALNVGVAAHISAASSGGARYDANMSTGDRCSANNSIWLCQTCAKLVDNDEHRFTVNLMVEWKRQAEAAAHDLVGKTNRSDQRDLPSSQRQIRRNLKIRDRLKRILLKPVEERRLKQASRPYEKFRTSKIVIRSVDDASYPKVDTAPRGRISSGLVLELYDFYHGGLEVTLSIRQAVIDDAGNWAFSDDDINPNEATWRIAKVVHLGRVPWRNICEIDERGDEYYRGPHLYCAFADDGMPYEQFVARELGDDYCWPLDPTKQMPDIML